MAKWRLALAAAAFLTVACDNDDSGPVLPPERDAVVFVTDDGAVTTTENIQSFRVSAYTDPGYRVVMNNVTVRRTGQNSWYYSPEVLWPEGDTTVTFIAITPPTHDIWLNSWWHNTISFIDSIGKSDICISTAYRVRQTDNRIRLNFRHTLARLQINVRSSIPGNHVFLRELTLFNVVAGCALFFPDETTAPDGTKLTRCWPDYVDELANAHIPYFISPVSDGIEIGSEPSDVSNTGNVFVVPFNPRPLEWAGYVRGSGFRLTCRICDSSGKQIWPDSRTNSALVSSGDSRWGYIYFPISPDGDEIRWHSGYTYRYTLNIANGGTLPGQSSRSPSNTITLEIE